MFPLAGKQVASSRQTPCAHGALDLEFSSEKIISSDSTDILGPYLSSEAFLFLKLNVNLKGRRFMWVEEI